MAATANALYVLRLVLNREAPRRFSTAVWAQPRAEQPLRRHAIASSSSLATATPVDNSFLEPESDDYETATSFLPDRPPRAATPIPWPTIFPHGEQERKQHPRACDLIARLVAENRLGPARKVYQELRALHTPIQHRHVYLSAAVSSLEPTEQGRADFLFWLELVPNRPALNNSPKLRKTWEPIVNQILAEHLDDQRFIADFIILTARKGLCPTILPLVTTPLAAIAKPDVSERVFGAAVDMYMKSVTSAHSTSPRASKFAIMANTQRERFWNMYLRSLAAVGWEDNARALLHSPPSDVKWSSFTQAMVLGNNMQLQEQKAQARAAKLEAEKADPLSLLIAAPPPELSQLSRDVRRALDSQSLPAVGELAALQRRLLQLGRVELLGRFQRRFCNPSGKHGGSHAPTVNEKWWYHAAIKRLADDGEHAAAIKVFRERFLWIGLPPAAIAEDTDASYAYVRRVPDARVITSVLPSILALLPPDKAPLYHRSYLKQALPPVMQPTEYTHLAFVRGLAHHIGPEAATTAIQTIAVAGLDPGVPAWNALLLKLIGTNQLKPALALLTGMEQRLPLSDTVRMPPPTARTYAGIVRLCVRHDHVNQASLVLNRFKAWIDASREEPGDVKNHYNAVQAQYFAAKGAIKAHRRGHPDRRWVTADEKVQEPSSSAEEGRERPVAEAAREEQDRAVG